MSKQKLIKLLAEYCRSEGEGEKETYIPYWELENLLTYEEIKLGNEIKNNLLLNRINKLNSKELRFILYNIINTTPHIEDNKLLLEYQLVNNDDDCRVTKKLLNKLTKIEIKHKILVTKNAIKEKLLG